MEKQIVDRAGWLSRLPERGGKLYAMYSSVTDCIVQDASLMLVPVDDHLVHRGDGVFESFKCLAGCIYNLNAHLQRLETSCARIGITLPVPVNEMADIVIQTVLAGGRENALIRLLVSRGPGTMGINPYECDGPECYVIVYEPAPGSMRRLPDGVSVGVSRIPVKTGFFATVKTCNYLPNVLMKKEAVDAGVDYTVSLDEKRNLAEGATENVGIVTLGKELFMPPPERVLAGTTARRAMEFALQLKAERLLTTAEYRPISLGMVRSAAEMHVYGTTPNITPVTEFDGKPVGDGTPGPIACRLFEMLREEMVPDSELLTRVF
jgi:branched-chain amino acid aminotransferase